jgi:hypothetical protein
MQKGFWKLKENPEKKRRHWERKKNYHGNGKGTSSGSPPA